MGLESTEPPLSPLSPDTGIAPYRTTPIINSQPLNQGPARHIEPGEKIGTLEAYSIPHTNPEEYQQARQAWEKLNPEQQRMVAGKNRDLNYNSVGIGSIKDGSQIQTHYFSLKESRDESVRAGWRKPVATVERVRSALFIGEHLDEENLTLQLALNAEPWQLLHFSNLEPGLGQLPPELNPLANPDNPVISGRLATVVLHAKDGEPEQTIKIARLDAVDTERSADGSEHLKVSKVRVPVIRALQQLGILTITNDGKIIDLEDPELEISTLTATEAMKQLGYNMPPPSQNKTLPPRPFRTLGQLFRWLRNK